MVSRKAASRHKIDVSEVLGLPQYESCRQEYRQRIIALKQKRRVALGALISILFENKETVLFQIQEAMRLEMAGSSTAVKEIIRAYAGLVPGAGQLSATMFVEVADLTKARGILARLAGLSRSVYIQLGNQEKVAAESQEKDETQAAAVSYIKFRLNSKQRELLKGASSLYLAIAHPRYKARRLIPEEVRKALLGDLAR